MPDAAMGATEMLATGSMRLAREMDGVSLR